MYMGYLCPFCLLCLGIFFLALSPKLGFCLISGLGFWSMHAWRAPLSSLYRVFKLGYYSWGIYLASSSSFMVSSSSSGCRVFASSQDQTPSCPRVVPYERPDARPFLDLGPPVRFSCASPMAPKRNPHGAREVRWGHLPFSLGYMSSGQILEYSFRIVVRPDPDFAYTVLITEPNSTRARVLEYLSRSTRKVPSLGSES